MKFLLQHEVEMVNVYDALFNYIKDILYNPGEAKLDVDELPAEARRLGEGMLFLGECIKEEKSYVKSLAEGDLSATLSNAENTLAAPIKALQASLRHLTWQTQQVAKGDYSQRVDFMGEFSDAFNSMVEQLKERSDRLQEEKKKTEEKNFFLAKNLEFVHSMIYSTTSMIFVFSSNDEKLLFTNHSVEVLLDQNRDAGNEIIAHLKSKDKQVGKDTEMWEYHSEDGNKTYRIESFEIMWSDEQAFVHIVEDDTDRVNRENKIYKFAYTDPLTGLGNRRSAHEQMVEWVAKKKRFIISFVDVDYLKYCNDKFGHKRGDEYLLRVAESLREIGGMLCRVGGDEFTILHVDGEQAAIEDRLATVREKLIKESKEDYPCSFSYATIEVPENPPKDLEDYARKVDRMMYQYKEKNKRTITDEIYRDGRIENIEEK